MKKALSNKSLQLRPETVRSLTSHELVGVGGAGFVMKSAIKDTNGIPDCVSGVCIQPMPTTRC